MDVREGIRFVEGNLAGITAISALQVQNGARPIYESGMSEFTLVISMNMRLSIAIRTGAVSVNQTDFNDHRTVGLIESK